MPDEPSDPPDPEAPEFDGFELTAVDAAGPGGQQFWRRIEHGEVVPDLVMRSAVRDLMPVEREEGWARGPGTVGPPRNWERPHDIDEAVEELNPQFVLRNLHRHEMDAWPNALWWKVAQVRTTIAEAASEIDRARAAGTQEREGALLNTLSYDEVAALKRAHEELTLHTPWAEFQWRRGPRGQDV